jgi:hypothetical protein
MPDTPAQLSIPDHADQDPSAFELLRIWTTSSGERVGLRVEEELPPEAWGIVLADVARHVAHAYAQKGIGNVRDNLRELLTRFLEEMRQPSDTIDGSVKP